MIRSVLTVFLLLASILPSPAVAAKTAGEEAPVRTDAAAASPAVEAESAVLLDVASGRILYAKNPDAPFPPASTAKILTALVVLERAGLAERITVSRSAATAQGSSMYLKPGQETTVEALLYGLLLESGNDAAAALAEHVAGSAGAFARLMNEKARALGAVRSAFRNASGLPAPGQHTTARDLATITRHALANPVFARIVATRRHTVTFPGGERRDLVNHNLLLGTAGIDGVKTGYTVEAGHTYVASATRDGWQLVAVVLRDSKRGKWRDAQDLLEYGFQAFRPIRLLRPGAPVTGAAVAGGRAARVPLSVAGNRAVTVPVRADGSESTYLQVETPPVLEAPVVAGQRAGLVRVFLNGRPMAAYPLVAARDVAAIPGGAGPRASERGAWPGLLAGWWRFLVQLCSRLRAS